jgi:hypothetical protein
MKGIVNECYNAYHVLDVILYEHLVKSNLENANCISYIVNASLRPRVYVDYMTNYYAKHVS